MEEKVEEVRDVR